MALHVMYTYIYIYIFVFISQRFFLILLLSVFQGEYVIPPNLDYLINIKKNVML